MAREYARLRVSSYDDPDVEVLSIEAQWLYYKVLLPHPSLSTCGVMDWRPKKLVRKARNAGPGTVKILAAAAELELGRFLMFDLETEEVLLRSYVRGDELLKNPKMAGAVIKAYQAVASRELQAALVTEFLRIQFENPEYSSWSHKDTAEDLARILSRPDLSTVGYTYAFSIDIGYGDTDADPVEIGNPDPVEIGNATADVDSYSETEPDGDVAPDADHPADSDPIPSTYTRSHKPAPIGGYVTGVPHQDTATADENPPPRTCPEHPDGTSTACPRCGVFRRAWEVYDAGLKRQRAEAQKAETHAANELRRAAIANCGMCRDSGGYVGTRPCDHDSAAAERNQRRLADARIAACRLCGEDGLRADGTGCDHPSKQSHRRLPTPPKPETEEPETKEPE